MVMTNGTDGTPRKVSSLGELSRNVAPSRDLWPDIAAQITAANESRDSTAGERRRLRPSGMQWAALAAVVASLAVGMWLGRSVLPAGGTPSRPATEGSPALAANNPGGTGAKSVAPATDPNALTAAFVTDPRYNMQRAALIRGLE